MSLVDFLHSQGQMRETYSSQINESSSHWAADISLNFFCTDVRR